MNYGKILGTITKRENRELLLLGALVVACLMWFKSCNSNKNTVAEMRRNEAIAKQNSEALKNQLRIEKNKAGDIEAVKSVFVTKLSELEKMNKRLFDDIKREKGEVRGLIQGISTGSVKDVVISNDVRQYSDGKTYGLTFEDTKIDSGMTWNIRGESKFKLENNTIYPGQTEIFNNSMKVKMTLGFKTRENGDYEVFARSGSPNVTFDDVSGVMIIPKKDDPILCPPPKKTKFSVGVQAGYGVGFLNKQVMLTPYVGIGVQYKIINF